MKITNRMYPVIFVHFQLYVFILSYFSFLLPGSSHKTVLNLAGLNSNLQDSKGKLLLMNRTGDTPSSSGAVRPWPFTSGSW